MRPNSPARVALTLAIGAAGVLLGPMLLDAVTVAPHALFLGDRNRVGEVVLINQGSTAEEIEIEFQFGYPQSDSTGTVTVSLVEHPASGTPSAAGWLRAFPRRVRLEPGQRQSIRVQATPPADLSDGEYWSRMIVTARQEPAPSLAVQGDSTGARAGLTFVLRTITSVTYRHGPVRTDVQLDSLSAHVAGDSLIAWIGLRRGGNAAFLGSVRFRLVGRDGGEVAAWDPTPIAVYYSLLRRYAFPLDSLPEGSYKLRVLVSTDRRDLPPSQILPASPIDAGVELEVP